MNDNLNKFLVIGGDKRYDCLSELLNEKSAYAVRINSPDELDYVNGSGFEAILPYPLSPDGVSVMFSDGGMSVAKLFSVLKEMGICKIHAGGVKEHMRTQADALGLDITDYGRDEALLQKNALCSAEGAIYILMRELVTTLHGSNFTVVGYGRIGKIISRKLKAMGANVKAVGRRAESFAEMSTDGIDGYTFDEYEKAYREADAVINTVPSSVLNEKELVFIPKDAFVLDLASSPGGVDRKAAEKLGVKVIWALSIPGKYCPKTAAGIIHEAVMRQKGAKE